MLEVLQKDQRVKSQLESSLDCRIISSMHTHLSVCGGHHPFQSILSPPPVCVWRTPPLPIYSLSSTCLCVEDTTPSNLFSLLHLSVCGGHHLFQSILSPPPVCVWRTPPLPIYSLSSTCLCVEDTTPSNLFSLLHLSVCGGHHPFQSILSPPPVCVWRTPPLPIYSLSSPCLCVEDTTPSNLFSLLHLSVCGGHHPFQSWGSEFKVRA
ncbi:unnamed protein product [Gadus morhua 'NCC']